MKRPTAEDDALHHPSSISLHVARAADILYPSPILSAGGRAIHAEVEEFLLSAAERLPSQGRIALCITVDHRDQVTETAVVDAIHHHFTHVSGNAAYAVKKIFTTGWRSLLVSLLFLIAMFLIAFLITKFLPENPIMITLRELFIILAWVALWRPADLLLYDWRTPRRKERLAHRLADGDVVFKTASAG